MGYNHEYNFIEMTNKELQNKVLADFKALGNITPWEFRTKKKYPNDFYPINKRAASEIANGNFEAEKVGKHGLLIMKDYFLNLDKTDSYERDKKIN